jgi:hypothetical protein
MPNLSRRHLVTTAAALPALAVPAFASEAIGPNHPDIELLRLGVELEAVIVEWHAQRAIDRKHSAAVYAALEAAGLSDIDHHRSLPDDEFRAYLAKRDAVTEPIYRASSDDVNEAGESIAWNDIHGRMWPMINAVLECKAQTLAGFAVQARAITLSHAELWEDAIGHDEDHRPFLEAACAFAGVVPVPLDGAAVQS